MTLIPNDYQKEFNEAFEISRKEIDALKAENKELNEQLRLHSVSNSEVFEHYGKPFTSGRDLWDFLTAHYNFTQKNLIVANGRQYETV